MKNSTISLQIDELSKNASAALLPVTIFIGIEAAIGLFGNVLILVVYSRSIKRSNFRCFVLSMAVIDLTSCCTTLPGEVYSQLNWYVYEYDWMCKIKSYFNVFSACASASILLLLAFDRHRKVCKPLGWQIRPPLALKLCGSSLLLSVCFAIPVIIITGKQTYTIEHDGVNMTVSICEGKSSKYADEVYPLVYTICVLILPIGLIQLVVCSLNVITAKKVLGLKSVKMQEAPLCSQMCSAEKTLTPMSARTEFIETYSKRPKANVSYANDKGGSKDGKGVETTNTSDRQVVNGVFSNDKVRAIPSLTDEFDTLCVQNSLSSESITKWEKASSNEIMTNVNDTEKTTSHRFNPSANDDYRMNKDRKDCPDTMDNNRGTKDSGSINARMKQKTVIMLVLTSVFMVTMSLYIILTGFTSSTDGILRHLTNSQKAVFFFFWRLYFINTVVNPVMYGFMDTQFRSGVVALVSTKKHSRRKRDNCKHV